MISLASRLFIQVSTCKHVFILYAAHVQFYVLAYDLTCTAGTGVECGTTTFWCATDVTKCKCPKISATPTAGATTCTAKSKK